MTGPIALHGGGEFQPGDAAFLRRTLELATTASGRGAKGDPIRIAIVPTAAARGRPALVGAYGTAAFEQVASSGEWAGGGLAVRVDVVEILDATAAADAANAASLTAADLIHLPGGDPDLIPTILGGTAAWDAIVSAHRQGAVLAGASAGAMALATWTWTPDGGVAGLGLVPGLVLVPHADPASWASAIERFGPWLPAGLGALGVTERTAVVSRPGDLGTWDVVGEGEARWLAPGEDPGSTLVVPVGGSLRLPSA